MTDADKVAFADWVTDRTNVTLTPVHRWADRTIEPPLDAELVFGKVANDGTVPVPFLSHYLDDHVGHAWRFGAAERVIGLMERVAAGDVADRPELEPALAWIAANAVRERPSLGA
jgi:hypothetical protein